MIVATVKTVRNMNKMKPSVCSTTPPPYNIKQQLECRVNVPFNKILMDNKTRSCRRKTAQCFVSLNISLSHSRSLTVNQNDTAEYRRACVTLY